MTLNKLKELKPAKLKLFCLHFSSYRVRYIVFGFDINLGKRQEQNDVQNKQKVKLKCIKEKGQRFRSLEDVYSIMAPHYHSFS